MVRLGNQRRRDAFATASDRRRSCWSARTGGANRLARCG